jgi:aryl-alcohol dehydrogenase-like predicted oxidoreductase
VLRLSSEMSSCTPSGSNAYASAALNSKAASAGHFRRFDGLTLSSIGMGTYLGEPDGQTDRLVEAAVDRSVRSGAINVLDTAINYRYQRAERSVGRALASLIADGAIERSQVFVSTKSGYLAPDAEYPRGPHRYVQEELLGKGVIHRSDIVGSSHCMTEGYLSHELDRSLSNLQLERIDLLYLHNAAESQIPVVGEEEFMRRLRAAFSFFEVARKEGKIAYYGMATWDCFRSEPVRGGDSEGDEGHLELEQVVDLAREEGGPENGFRFIQFPLNLAMPEALTSQTQTVGGGEQVTLLEACLRLEIGAFTSVPLMQGRLVGNPRTPKINSLTSSQVNLQFARSSPGVISPLAGQKQPTNVEANVALAKFPPLTRGELWKYFMS